MRLRGNGASSFGRALALLATSFGALLLLAGCTVVGSSPQTSAVFTTAPWRVGERLEYRLSTGSGEEVGRGVLTAQQEGAGLVLRQSYTGASSGSDEIALTVDPKTLVAMQGTRETSRRSSDSVATASSAWAYRLDGARLRLDTLGQGGAVTESTDLGVQPHAYDNESSLWLWRGLAFAEGYEQSYVSVNPVDGSRQVVTVRVPQHESVTVPAGTFDAWRVIVRSGRAVRTAWISSQAPYPVVRWDNGDVVFELIKAE